MSEEITDALAAVGACPAGGNIACRCTPCAVCGYGPHRSIHGSHDGYPPQSPPMADHAYAAQAEASAAAPGGSSPEKT
jgi:hypothetical protein